MFLRKYFIPQTLETVNTYCTEKKLFTKHCKYVNLSVYH